MSVFPSSWSLTKTLKAKIVTVKRREGLQQSQTRLKRRQRMWYETRMAVLSKAASWGTRAELAKQRKPKAHRGGRAKKNKSLKTKALGHLRVRQRDIWTWSPKCPSAPQVRQTGHSPDWPQCGRRDSKKWCDLGYTLKEKNFIMGRMCSREWGQRSQISGPHNRKGKDGCGIDISWKENFRN